MTGLVSYPTGWEVIRAGMGRQRQTVWHRRYYRVAGIQPVAPEQVLSGQWVKANGWLSVRRDAGEWTWAVHERAGGGGRRRDEGTASSWAAARAAAEHALDQPGGVAAELEAEARIEGRTA